MPSRYRPATTQYCPTCEKLGRNGRASPIFNDAKPHATEVNSYPIHNWYVFTLGYSPRFVRHEFSVRGIEAGSKVMDPFVGMGTTLVECKLQGIESYGVDASEFAVFAAKCKTNWDIDLEDLDRVSKRVTEDTATLYWKYGLSAQPLRLAGTRERTLSYHDLFEARETQHMLKRRHVSERPLAKLLLLRDSIDAVPHARIRDLLRLAFASIVVPASNVRYGPAFGLIRPVDDVDVLSLFNAKVTRIIKDLKHVAHLDNPKVESTIVLGDTRQLSEFTDEHFDFAIGSPPYPGEHDYTRQTRLELVLLGFAKTMGELRKIKKRMIRSSTRSIYKMDHEAEEVLRYDSITSLMEEIDKRVAEQGGTSGFEKLYSKLVGEYFGGMYRSLLQIYEVLKSKATVSFLVGDSHTFKMVHIETAKILGEIAADIGYSGWDLRVWQYKRSTSHSYRFPEYILALRKD